MSLSVGYGLIYLFGRSSWFTQSHPLRLIVAQTTPRVIYAIVFLVAAILIAVPRREVRAAGYMLGAVLFGYFTMIFLLHAKSLLTPIPILNYFGNATFFAVSCYETLFYDDVRRLS